MFLIINLHYISNYREFKFEIIRISLTKTPLNFVSCDLNIVVAEASEIAKNTRRNNLTMVIPPRLGTNNGKAPYCPPSYRKFIIFSFNDG
jgi:hypothetical protein